MEWTACHRVQGRIHVRQQVANDIWRDEIIREKLWHDRDGSKLVNGSGSWRADWECWIGWVRNQVRRGKCGERDDDEKEQGKECFHKRNPTTPLLVEAAWIDGVSNAAPNRVRGGKFMLLGFRWSQAGAWLHQAPSSQ